MPDIAKDRHSTTWVDDGFLGTSSRIQEAELGHRIGLSRVGRGEDKGSRRWVDLQDDPDRARSELAAGTCGVDVASGQMRMRVGGLPLLRRTGGGTRRQAVRAIVDWPYE